MSPQPLPAHKLAAYRDGILRRLSQTLTAEERATLDAARRAAHRIAEMLVRQHSAQRVILFGSVARDRRLRPEADIDLAVVGMPAEAFYRLAGDLRSDDGRAVDLVRLETLPPAFRQVIEIEGRVLAHDGD